MFFILQLEAHYKMLLQNQSFRFKFVIIFLSDLFHEFYKLIGRDLRLLENAAQSPNCNFIMQGNNAADTSFWRGLFQDNMASTLTCLNESKPFQCAQDFPSG